MTNTSPTRITDIIHVHSLTLMVYSHDSVQYINAKNIVEFAGLAWRSAKRTLIQPTNTKLYGILNQTETENTLQGDNDVTPPEHPDAARPRSDIPRSY